jgi:hypothetical protein
MGDGTTVKLFEKRVNWLNQCLKYFPMIDMTNGQLKTCESLEQDNDLRDIYYTLAIKAIESDAVACLNLVNSHQHEDRKYHLLLA